MAAPLAAALPMIARMGAQAIGPDLAKKALENSPAGSLLEKTPVGQLLGLGGEQSQETSKPASF